MKDHSSQLSDKKNGLWGQPHLAEILGQTGPVGANTPTFNRHSAVRPSEKSSFNTNKTSTTSFPMSLK